jgi:hypothetical protein
LPAAVCGLMVAPPISTARCATKRWPGDIVALMKCLGIEKAGVMGYSLGAGVALCPHCAEAGGLAGGSPRLSICRGRISMGR